MSKDVTSVRYAFPAEIKYGLTDFIETGLGISYVRGGMPSKTTGYVGSGYYTDIYYVDEMRGMTDLLLYASLRLPVAYKFFDMSLGGGIYLPTARHQPGQPQHSLASVERVIVDDLGEYTVTEKQIYYRYDIPNGSGVPVYRLAGSAKMTVRKISLQADGFFLFPAKTGTNIRWSHSLHNGVFSYTSEEYEYLTDRSVYVNAALHYQINGWLDVHLTGACFASSGGWTERYGRKYAHPEQKLWTMEPGFAIQVSPALTFYQTVTIPVSGKNIDGWFGVSITASFNLFPFFKEKTP